MTDCAILPPPANPDGPCRADRNGFTLLEVMVALAITAMVLSALLGLTNRLIGVHARLRHTTQATQLAQYKMAELETGQLAGEDAEGAFVAPFEEYRWQVAIAGTPFAAVRQVTVAVRWDGGQPHQAVELVSFLMPRESADEPTE